MNLRAAAFLLALLLFVGCGSSTNADFGLSDGSTKVTLVNNGASQSVPVTVTSTGGFSGPVSLAVSGLPTGVTASPSTLSLAPGQLGQFTLTAAGASTASSSITITGTSGATTHSVTAAVTVTPDPSPTPDFVLSADSNPITLVDKGDSQTLAVSVSAVGSFATPVSISLTGLPAGVTASPATLSISPGQLGQFTLTASGAAAGSSALTVVGVSGTLTHSQAATLNVTADPSPTPDFTLTDAAPTLTLENGGASQSFAVAVSAVGSFADPVNLTLSGLPAGVTATPATLPLTPGQAGQFTLTAAGAATGATTITVTGTSGSYSHAITATVNVTPNSAPAPDFALSDDASPVTLVNGQGGQSVAVAVAAVGGFQDPVSVTLSGLPTGVTATPATLSLIPGQLGKFVLSASGAAVTSTSFTLTGTSGSLTHTATATVKVLANPAPTPDFSLSGSAAPVLLVNGGSSQTASVVVNAIGGFSDPVTLSLAGLPAGVTASPASLNVTPGQLGQFTLTASGATVASSSLTITATSGSLTHSIFATLEVTPAVSNASLNVTSFDYGGNLVGSTLTRSVVTVTNTGTAQISLNPTLSGDSSYALVAGQSCGATLAAGSSCAETVSYTPAGASGATPQAATLNLGLGNVPQGTAQTVSLTGLSATVPTGTVTSTHNPQVAQYSITLPFPGSVTVNFGADTTYGRQTWSQSTSANGQTINMLVAGMLPNSTYHMQATVQLNNGATATDTDHTFATGTPEVISNITVTTTPGFTPQSGIEQLSTLEGNSFGIVMTDLRGGVLWSYALPNNPVGQPGADEIDGVKLLPNGHFLMTVGQGSGNALNGNPMPAGAIVAIREIDLAGNIVHQFSAADLSNELQAAGYNLTLSQFHHDVTPLANGHTLVLSNTLKAFTNLPGYPGVTNVLGDVVIDLDQNMQPVWVWNEFDHLDVNRHPMAFPDWTHTNAIVYSPTDHNLIISMRHQNWVVKVDYKDGAGSGDILWRLGKGGDFTLVGGTDPTDWQYAQHYPSLFTPNSAGIFSLGMMDNGNDRMFPDGGLCGTSNEPACYTTIPVFQIDEGAKTATLQFHQILPTSLYSFFGGNTELLANGNIEYDLAGPSVNGVPTSDVFEVTPNPANPETVWHMHLTTSQAYRAYRIPSLYPGVQW